MTRLYHDKLHVTFTEPTAPEGPITPRRYTLTHSDRTGDLFLTIGAEYDHGQISGWRFAIFRRELPLVLEALRYGDARLFESHEELDNAPIWVHLYAVEERYNVVERWGVPADWA